MGADPQGDATLGAAFLAFLTALVGGVFQLGRVLGKREAESADLRDRIEREEQYRDRHGGDDPPDTEVIK